MNITRAAAPSTQAVSPGLILTRCAAAAASQTVSTRHPRFGHPSDGGRLDERLRGATRNRARFDRPFAAPGSVLTTKEAEVPQLRALHASARSKHRRLRHP